MASRQPNVVVFFTDQQRWDTTGVHGNPMDLTPNFDRMAMEGTHCYNAFTCQPVCLPARLVLQTGRYASQFGAYNNLSELPVGTPTLGHYYREAGYRTAYIGKWHMTSLQEHGPVAPERRDGYDYWLGANVLEFTSDAYQTTMHDGDGQPVRLPGYRVDAQTDAAIRYIDAQQGQDQPFFLMCSYLEPHFQNSRDDFPAPTGYEERYRDPWTPPDLRALGGSSAQHLPGYYGMVKRLDEALGRLLDALRSLDLLDSTIVLFATDHGCHFKTRNSEYKRSCHESSLRIPMALSGPGLDSGGRLQELVSLIDLPPTLLDACDIPVPDNMQGRSILPLTRGRVADWPEEVYAEMFETSLSRCVRTQRWKYSVRRTEPGLEMGDAQFAEDCLYDLLADPYELNNLVGRNSHRQVADVMKDRLARRMQQAGEPAPTIENAPEKPGGQQASDASLRGAHAGRERRVEARTAELRDAGSRVPLPASTDARTPAYAAREPQSEGGRSARILLVEDNAMNQQLAGRRLRKLGHTAVIAEDGRQALAALEKERFDLVLMDVQMPEMDGLEATAAIREKEKSTGDHIPIIAMTAHGMEGDRDWCLEAGMDDYLPKPLDNESIAAAIGKWYTSEASEGRPRAAASAEELEAAIDVASALRRVDGDRGFLRGLLGEFLGFASAEIETLRQAIRDGDAHRVELAGHSIKGAAANLAAERVCATAARLEEMGRASRLDGAQEVVDELAAEVERLRDSVKVWEAEDGEMNDYRGGPES